MIPIDQLPNIGEKLANDLMEAGITNKEELLDTGTKKAFIKLATIRDNCCINALYALEGAVQGIRWHNLSDARKDELKTFFYQLK